MKTIILIIFLFFGTGVNAQQEDNVFQKSENQATGVDARKVSGNDQIKEGQPPGDDDPVPAPIDNYIPVLIIAGISLVIYQNKKKKKVIQ